MENADNNRMDEALVKLLNRATDPAIPEGAEARLMTAVRAAGQQSNVVPFPQRSKIQNWAIGVPLAASLVLGIYVGSRGTLDNYLPQSIVGESLADTSESGPPSGLDDAESYEEGGST